MKITLLELDIIRIMEKQLKNRKYK